MDADPHASLPLDRAADHHCWSFGKVARSQDSVTSKQRILNSSRTLLR
jgi:hypothetical protein